MEFPLSNNIFENQTPGSGEIEFVFCIVQMEDGGIYHVPHEHKNITRATKRVRINSTRLLGSPDIMNKSHLRTQWELKRSCRFGCELLVVGKLIRLASDAAKKIINQAGGVN